MIALLAVAGAAAVAAGWRLVARGRVSIWLAQGVLLPVLAVLSLLTGLIAASARVRLPVAVLAGLGAGFALYLATIAFVAIVTRWWPAFTRGVTAIYGQQGRLSALAAAAIAALVAAPGGEIFWRGLVQPRLAATLGWTAAAAATYVAYVAANAASGNLPIAAGAVVAGGVWTALAWWTHGVAAGICCHALWTGLMVLVPPGGRRTA